MVTIHPHHPPGEPTLADVESVGLIPPEVPPNDETLTDFTSLASYLYLGLNHKVEAQLGAVTPAALIAHLSGKMDTFSPSGENQASRQPGRLAD